MTHPRKPKGPSDTAALQRALQEAFPDGRWLAVLELLAHTGVADAAQMRAAAGLSPDRLAALEAKCRALGGEAILARVPFSVHRPGTHGRRPLVYTLGETGAALLRANGHAQAHACALREEKALAHAQAVLDVRLAALKAGLAVQTEAKLRYVADGGGEQFLRPDNLVTLADGTRALFEVEQEVTMGVLRRIAEGLERKAEFFGSGAGKAFSPTVRVLLNLLPGKAWERTVAVWERAAAIVGDERGGALGFDLRATPLQPFLEAPDWSEPPQGERWESLFDPARSVHFGPPALPAGKARGEAKARPPAKQLPPALARRTAPDDRRVMLAYFQHVQERGPALACTPQTPLPDPAFFEVMAVIHLASHGPQASAWQQASYPFASVYLLGRYLAMHKPLREALNKALARGEGRINWSVTTVLHRMQVVIDTFLAYHGLRSGESLRAAPVSSWGRTEGNQDFQVSVCIAPEVLMGEGSGVVPGREEVRAAEAALAWVLWALFAHGEALGLRRPGFW